MDPPQLVENDIIKCIPGCVPTYNWPCESASDNAIWRESEGLRKNDVHFVYKQPFITGNCVGADGVLNVLCVLASASLGTTAYNTVLSSGSIMM